VLAEADWGKPDLGDDYLVALGTVAYWSGRIEGSMFWLAAGLVDGWYRGDHDPDERAVIATRGLGFQALYDLIIRLLDLRDAAGYSEVRLSLRNAKTVMSERNRVLHGDWWPVEDDSLAAFTTRNWRSVEFEEMSVESLRDIANRLSAIAKRLEMAHDQVFHPGQSD
jgi:hypothetical protein